MQHRKLAYELEKNKQVMLDKFINNKSIKEATCFTCTSQGCCKQLLVCALFEAYIIYDRLNLLKRTDLVEKLIEHGKLMEFMLKDRNLDSQNYNSYRELCLPWFISNKLCPLAENNKCVIYDIRPTTCASYFTKNPSSDCESPIVKTIGCYDNSHELLYTIKLDMCFTTITESKITGPAPLSLLIKKLAQDEKQFPVTE